MGTICLVPLHVNPKELLLAELALRLERTFLMGVRIEKAWFDPEKTYEPSRGQYHSTHMLRLLLDGLPVWATRVLGVTSVDLFVPVLTYVFGEAQLEGPAAVVSLHRLRPDVYGLPPDPRLLDERLEKEAIHELGHTCGLVHCVSPRCVMRPSTYAEDIDLKPASFCLSCLVDVRKALA